MPDAARTLDFGVTFDSVVRDAACGNMLTLSAHRSNDGNPPHRHVNDFLCVVLAGRFAESRDDGWRERRSGSFFVHHAGDIHHDRFGAFGAICLSLHFPAGRPPLAGLDGRCSTSARIAANSLALELAGPARDELVEASLSAELLAEIRLSAAPRDHRDWLERIVEAIADDPRRRWTLAELARIAERHPVHIAQAFRATTGLSLGAFQRQRRLIGLSLALRRDADSLAMLASEFGYCDQSHMNAEFRAVFGIGPGRFRRSCH